jgi:hypothetical protein
MPVQNAKRLMVLGRLGRAQWRLAIAAATTLAMASSVLRLTPFRRAIRFGSVALGRKQPRPSAVRDCVWAIEAIGRRVPWRSACIQQGLALQRMLRVRGVDARLHYGARQDAASGRLEAHVWVTVGGEAVIGGAEAGGFAEVAAYP